MNDRHLDRFLDILQIVATNFARFVSIQYKRLEIDKLHMTIDDTLLQQILDVANACLAAETGDVAVEAQKDALIASLQTQLAPNPALLSSAQTFLTNALAANPPATPVTPVTPAPVGAP
jgi:hypothetical protein